MISAVLVCYYKPEAGTVVVEYLSSLELIRVNAESVYDAIVDLFATKAIPWDNLVSMLMDSCNVMRGSKTGFEILRFEIRIREQKARHLLDIDGDSCHHIHNCAKEFCKPFKNYAESLFMDLYNDSKWSSDVKDLMSEICHFLGMKFTTPDKYVSHRWLSVYDCWHKAFV